MFDPANRLPRTRLVLLILALAGLTSPGALCPAQESAEAPLQPSASDDKPTAWQRLVYVPYRNIKQVFQDQGAAVFIPYAEFLKRWQTPGDGDAREAPPAVPAVITSAAYVGRVEKDIARIDVELTVQVLGKPWVELPLRFGDAAIGRMTASDEKTLLRGMDNGSSALLFASAGRHKVQLELTTRVRASPDSKGLEFEAPPSGVTTFELTVPAADQSVELSPHGIVTANESADQTTRIRANLGATKRIVASWRPRVSAAPVMEVLTTVENTLDVRIADGLMHTHATLVHHVLRGRLDRLEIVAPLDHRVLDVAAAGLKSWKAVREDQFQLITVDLLAGSAGDIVVEVHTEWPLPEGAVPLAGLDQSGAARGVHAAGDVRETGLLVVSQSADLSLAVEQQTGLVRIETAEAPERLRRPDSLAFKFYTPKFTLAASVRPVEPRVLADQATQLVLREEEWQLSSRIAYTVERAGVFELRARLPAGLQVDRVECPPMQEFQTPEGTGELVVSLRERTRGPIHLVVSGHLPIEATQTAAAPLPLLEPLGTVRETGMVAVFAPESLEVIADDGAIQGAQPTRVSPEQAASVPQARLAAAWTYTRRPVIPVRTERKPTRLTATVATTVNARQDLTEVITLLSYSVSFAGLETFRFAVPEAVAASIQVEAGDGAPTPIRQQSRAPDPIDGWVIYTVELQRETTGVVPLRVRYDLRPQGDARQATVTVQPLRVLESPGRAEGAAVAPASIQGEVAVQKDRALSVAARAPDLEPIDVRELSLLPADGFLAYRYFRQPEALATPFTIELGVSRNEVQPVIETVVSHALVEAVVTEDRAVTYRCRYRLKTSERQRLLLELPSDVEILDALAAGKRVELERAAAAAPSGDWDAFHINVARATPSDEPFVVALVFRAPFKDSPLRGRGGNLRLPLPRLGGAPAAGQPAVAIQQLRAAVWAPRDRTLVGQPEGFVPDRPTSLSLSQGAVAWSESAADAEQWFGDSGSGLFAFAPTGRLYQYSRLGAVDALEVSYWRTAWFTWTISLAVAAAALILSRTSWQNRLTIVLALAFAAALYALRDADLTVNLIAAARFGLLAGGLYWLVHALTRPRSRAPSIVWRPGDPATAVSALAAVIPPPELFEKAP